ncbi:MAG: shikimate dehydrogenase [Gammaproteobacteria bacterium]|nr:shikimate dehydrogenase [Gammaproteobacteria bacterium]
MTDRYAVVGNPVAHSLSPTIHAEFARVTGEDLTYGTLEAPIDGFARAADRFLASGRGLNVTVPFKLDAWRWVDRHDDYAAAAGAVNTIVPTEDGWLGCNTDGVGLVADLTEHLRWQVAGARTLILGAGGAVQGVVGALSEAGAEDVAIANRTVAKAQALADRFGVRACSLDEVGGGWDLIVNGTSAGLAGTGGLIAGDAVAGGRCYDMFYTRDGATPFCTWAKAQGARAVADGLGMLVEQAAQAFYLWRGVRPDTASVLALIRGGGPS